MEFWVIFRSHLEFYCWHIVFFVVLRNGPQISAIPKHPLQSAQNDPLNIKIRNVLGVLMPLNMKNASFRCDKVIDRTFNFVLFPCMLVYSNCNLACVAAQCIPCGPLNLDQTYEPRTAQILCQYQYPYTMHWKIWNYLDDVYVKVQNNHTVTHFVTQYRH